MFSAIVLQRQTSAFRHRWLIVSVFLKLRWTRTWPLYLLTLKSFMLLSTLFKKFNASYCLPWSLEVYTYALIHDSIEKIILSKVYLFEESKPLKFCSVLFCKKKTLKLLERNTQYISIDEVKTGKKLYSLEKVVVGTLLIILYLNCFKSWQLQ